MKPVHIRAEPGSIAERVVVVGDPTRARMLSEMLESPRIVNEHRGFHVYTGKWRGVDISVAVHGIGGASAAIVFEELAMYGAKVLVRLGTTGGLVEELDLGDIVVVTGAAYYPGGAGLSGYTGLYCMATAPNPLLTTRIYERLRGKSGNKKVVLGPVVTSDSFYAEDPEFVKTWSSRGMVAVEMECATLFSLGWMRGLDTAAVLVVSDSLVKHKEVFLTSEELADSIKIAAEAVFDVLAEWKPMARKTS